MLKQTLLCMALLPAVFCSVADAGYARNQAVAVEKVLYGDIVSVRRVTEQELVEDKYQGWRTFGGALLGGVVGHQFGGGNGQDVATVLGALLGGALGHKAGGDYYRQYSLVELMIRQEDGSEVMVLQDEDPSMVFQSGDEVRVVYLVGSVRVDKAM